MQKCSLNASEEIGFAREGQNASATAQLLTTAQDKKLLVDLCPRGSSPGARVLALTPLRENRKVSGNDKGWDKWLVGYYVEGQHGGSTKRRRNDDETMPKQNPTDGIDGRKKSPWTVLMAKTQNAGGV